MGWTIATLAVRYWLDLPWYKKAVTIAVAAAPVGLAWWLL